MAKQQLISDIQVLDCIAKADNGLIFLFKKGFLLSQVVGFEQNVDCAYGHEDRAQTYIEFRHDEAVACAFIDYQDFYRLWNDFRNQFTGIEF